MFLIDQTLLGMYNCQDAPSRGQDNLILSWSKHSGSNAPVSNVLGHLTRFYLAIEHLLGSNIERRNCVRRNHFRGSIYFGLDFMDRIIGAKSARTKRFKGIHRLP